MDSIDETRGDEAARLLRSVSAALDLIAVARVERTAAPVRAARRDLAEIYGLTRLRRRRERLREEGGRLSL